MKNANTTGNNSIKIGAFSIIVLLSVILSVALSWYKVSYSFSVSTEEKNIMQDEFISDNVEFNSSTGEYIPVNNDPWILFQGYNDEFDGVLVEIEEPVINASPVTLYWTAANSDILSESHTKNSQFDEGQKTCYLKLPSYAVNYVRLDIDRECVIKGIYLCHESPEITYGFGSEFVISVLIRFAIILILLIFAYKSHAERSKKFGHPVKGLFLNENSADHKYEYDYLRTLAALCVIAEHSVCEAYTPNVSLGDPGYGTLRFILALSICCNVLYVMLSGALILVPREESFKTFYIKRLGKVLIPLVSYFLLYIIQGYHNEVFADGIGPGMKEIFKGLLTGRSDYMPHMWLVYVILGLYILAPLFRIVIAKISEGTLLGIIVAGFIFNCLTTYLPIADINFGIDTPIAGWLGVFLLGYYMTTEHAKKYYWIFIAGGLVGIVTAFLMVYYRPELLYHTSNWTPNMWLVGAGLFAVVLKCKKIFSRPSVIIASISKYNFSIMLIHVLLLLKFVLPYGWSFEADHGHLTLCVIGMILACFIFSYVVAFVFDNTVITAINYIYNKITKKALTK
ncbi:MAG: acyltransferase [Lachnospiraceae bacterium]|nr:acyltransferase [Lachnospiraceae bacterium]